jgi:hypothetical protein
MGHNQSNLSDHVHNKLRVRVEIGDEVNVSQKKLAILESNIDGAGLGLFALEKIRKGTAFLDADIRNGREMGIGYYINDMAYNGSSENYETDVNVIRNINVGYLRQTDITYDMYGKGHCEVWYYAMKDIEKGDELSRFYGLQYWQGMEFWKRHPESKFQQTGRVEDLPSEYVFIDRIRRGINFNHNVSVFAKKVERRYYYLAGYGDKYFVPGFFTADGSKFTDITKADFSPYTLDEVVHQGMMFDSYLTARNRLNKQTNSESESDKTQTGVEEIMKRLVQEQNQNHML